MGGYDVVALVSGGKDSVMAAMLAESYGHRVVALGNLLPADASVEELDSHCFQTVGHNAVGAYGELTGLPLFRRRLRGVSRHTEMTYEIGTEQVVGDEVEDLRALLAAVIEKMPNVKAVTAGAILSDYQRLRVEAVCADLGLVSLAYLWQQPQPLVLDLICDSNVDAILIKVAAMGLEPNKHLGKTLDAMRPLLRKIERDYGSHCAGEGGEFETLVLDCPLFRRAFLTIDGPPCPTVEVTSNDSYAPSGHLAVAASAVLAVAKDDGGTSVAPGEVIDVNGPAPAPRVMQRTASESFDIAEACGVTLGAVETGVFSGAEAAQAHVHARVAALHLDGPAAAAAASAETALHAAAKALYETFGLDWSDVDYVQLCVNDMSHFAAVNAAYVRVVPVHSPPSRACVQLPLPEGVPCAVEVFASRHVDTGTKPPPRRSLHVQSLSCWAPACIGPYAQCATRVGVAHLAGSIGMDPATLAIVGVGRSRKERTKLEARRAWRSAAVVAKAAGCDLARDMVAVTMFVVGDPNSDPEAEHASNASDEALENVLRGDRQFLEVDVPRGACSEDAGVPAGKTRDDEGEEDEEDADADNIHEYSPNAPKTLKPLVTYVLVPGLPKNAAVEVQPVLLDGTGPGTPVLSDSVRSEIESDSEDELDPVGVRNRSVVATEGEGVSARYVKSRWCFARVALLLHKVSSSSIEHAVRIGLGGALSDAQLGWQHAGSLRGYYTVGSKLKESELRGWIDDAIAAAAASTGGDGGKKDENKRGGFQCALAPVLGCGFGDTKDAGLVLELFAATRGGGRPP